MLSKLARPFFKPKRCISFFQARKFSTPKREIKHPRALYDGLEQTVLDRAVGIKNDPRMLIDLKPFEWRTGNYKSYFENPGVMVTAIISLFIFALCIGNMIWINFRDVTVR